MEGAEITVCTIFFKVIRIIQIKKLNCRHEKTASMARSKNCYNLLGGQHGKIYQHWKHKASDLASILQLHKDIYTSVFNEPLFVIEKHQTQPKYLSRGWVRLWHIHTKEYYAITKNQYVLIIKNLRSIIKQKRKMQNNMRMMILFVRGHLLLYT